MARLMLVGAETGDLSELVSVGASTAVDSTQFNVAGAYSIKTTGTSATDSLIYGGFNHSRLRLKAMVRLSDDTVTGAAWFAEIFSMFAGASISGILHLLQTPAGSFVLRMADSSTAEVGRSAALTFVKNTWYRIELDITIGAGTGACTVYFEGTSVLTLSSQQFGAGNMTRWWAGAQFTTTGRDLWFDDLEADDSALCGAGYVIARQIRSGTPTYNDWLKASTTIDGEWSDTPFSASSFARSVTSNAKQVGRVALFSAAQSGHGVGIVEGWDTINSEKFLFVAKTAYTTAAGISQVGNILGVGAANGGDCTLTFSTAPIAGDLVIVWGGHTSTRATPIGPSTSGYALWPGSSVQTQSTNTFGVWYKIMGTTPDTSAVGQGTGNIQDAAAYGCIVLRGVDTSSISDATIVFANGSSTNPDPGSITPGTTGAAVVICAGGVVNDSTWTNPANYSTTVAGNATDNNPYSVGGSVRLAGLTGGTPENPAAFTGVTTSVWIAATIAVKPSTEAGSVLYPHWEYQSVYAGADDTAVSLTTSDALYGTPVYAPGDALSDISITEIGVKHGNTSALQTVEDMWFMISYTPQPAPARVRGFLMLM